MAASLSDLTRLVEWAGLDPELLQQAMTDPNIRRLVSENSATQSHLDFLPSQVSPGDEGDEDLPAKLLEQAKAAHLRDQFLPPIKAPQISRSALLASFARPSSRSRSTNGSTAVQIRQNLVGTSPGYATTILGELRRVGINDMFARMRQEGAYLLCRIISLTSHTVSVDMIVEDPFGIACMLAVYRYPTTLDCTEEQADAIFPIGTILAVREPCYRLPPSGKVPYVRVDAPSDIVFLGPDSALLNDVSWAARGPSVAIRQPDTAAAWKDRGNHYFKRKEWICAASAFSDGLVQDPENHLLLLNRSAAYLELGWFRSAAYDAERVIGMNLQNPQLVRKAVYRAAKAYYLSGRYDDVRRLSSGNPDGAETQQLCRSAEQRLCERDSGQYDWASIFSATRAPASRPDIAAYLGPVEVRTPTESSRPRGLFVTQNVKAGDLLMVSKPIASYFPEDTPSKRGEASMTFNMLKNAIETRGEYALVDLIVHRLWDDPGLASIIQAMYAGEGFPTASAYAPVPPTAAFSTGCLSHSRVPGVDIDIGRVEGVAAMDVFDISEHPVTFLVSASEQDEGNKPEHPAALYELPSFCNHACLPSAGRAFFGDVMVVRATQDLKAGEEVTMSYYDSTETYQKRTDSIQRQWQFACDCLLCKADLSDTAAARSQRAEAVAMLSSLGIAAIKQRIAQIKSSYSDSPERRQCGVKPELYLASRRLGFAYCSENSAMGMSFLTPSKAKACLIAFMDALEAVGLVITDRSVSGQVINPSALPVDTTRLPALSHLCTVSVIQMVSALWSIGENVRAKNWLKVAIRIENFDTGGAEALFREKYHSVLIDLPF
ncbi:hypothetical protein EIP91_008733 [Steccherinum ochraceum]|uniref:SET domain-containing protein n=1 Tax=Steccherinum ochraceum TaxID=92696 RepID=A0A4R0RKR4_9APHY|nr:hypothetical protein EIP91_008733 [Steccherinum ochraceum]